jgi:head-tail adaptor
MLSAGDLDRRVTLQRATATVDPRFGSALPAAWAAIATVWAQRLPVRDDERVRAAQVGAVVTDRWRLRWSPELAGLGARDQLVDVETGQAFGITAVKEIVRRSVLELTTSASDD